MSRGVQQPAVLGIDVGLDGAVAALAPDGTLRLHPTPTLPAGPGAKREYDIAGMKALLTAQPITLAVGDRPGRGVMTTFRFGHGYGPRVGLLSAPGISSQPVATQQWKREILGGAARDKAA